MRKILVLFVLGLLAIACTKTEETPDLALTAAGSYRVTELRASGSMIIPTNTIGQRLPTTALVSINRTSTNTISASMTVTDPTGSQTFQLGSFTLKGNVDDIDIINGISEVGFITKQSTLVFNVNNFSLAAVK